MVRVRYLTRVGQRILRNTRHLRELQRVGAIRKRWGSLYPNLPSGWIRREYTTELGTWTTAETLQGDEWLGGDPVPSDKEKLAYILGRNNGHTSNSNIRHLLGGDNVYDITSNQTGERQ